MKILIIITFLFITHITVCSAQPNIWSVSKDPAQKAAFSEIQDAIDAASPGDYIYIYPSIYENGFTLEKSLIVVGPGYFLGDNLNTQVNKSPAHIKGEISIGANTAGTILTGLYAGNKVSIQNTNNILIKRNWISSLQIKESIAITVKQNYIHGSSLTEVSNIHYSTLYIGSNTSNINILNNYIKNNDRIWISGSRCAAVLTAQNNSVSCLLRNNILDGYLNGYNISFENNILVGGSAMSLTTCSYKNNIASGTSFGSSDGNQSNVYANEIFVGSFSNPSADGQWQLKEGSPAKEAGLDGVDCGMFGGSDPYVLSGIPEIPAIYFFQAPEGASTTNGLPVHLKIKSHQ